MLKKLFGFVTFPFEDIMELPALSGYKLSVKDVIDDVVNEELKIIVGFKENSFYRKYLTLPSKLPSEFCIVIDKRNNEIDRGTNMSVFYEGGLNVDIGFAPTIATYTILSFPIIVSEPVCRSVRNKIKRQEKINGMSCHASVIYEGIKDQLEEEHRDILKSSFENHYNI
jgi:hypothetical protein